MAPLYNNAKDVAKILRECNDRITSLDNDSSQKLSPNTNYVVTVPGLVLLFLGLDCKGCLPRPWGNPDWAQRALEFHDWTQLALEGPPVIYHVLAA
mmetsp:Transcript_8821/g.14327  ORF Transcript_8821/g.14327 Transcript_8821/m.14327 type:complete len:96 (+) Transcript_8821:305-592(+)